MLAVSAAAHPKEGIPSGLSESDWSSIRAAYEGERHAFRLQNDGTHRAWNPRQGWHTEFDGEGFLVRPREGSWVWGLELRSVGNELLADRPIIRASSGKLSYRWSERVEEWFINDKRGLEQGWTVRERVNGLDAPLTLTFGLRGSLTPKIADSGRAVSFLKNQAAILVYGGLKAWDANGLALDVRFVEIGGSGRLGIEVDDREAVYPIVIDPIAQLAYLKASNAGRYDSFGFSVAVSGDTVVVGAPGERGDSNSTAEFPNDDANGSVGAVYVFTRSGSTWNQEAYLKPSDPDAGQSVFDSDKFGYSVAFQGDTIIVGAPGEAGDANSTVATPNDLATNAGAVFVFVRSGTDWSQQAYLKASNVGAEDQFGWAVALENDILVVGAPREQGDSVSTAVVPNDNANWAGAVYVFERSGSSWSHEAYLKSGNIEAGDLLGVSVAISGDTLVAGAGREAGDASSTAEAPNNNGFIFTGAAYVFVRSGGSWSQQGYLKASNAGSPHEFGYSVAIANDTIVVGAPNEEGDATSTVASPNDDALEAGAAYVFVRNGIDWSQQAYLKAANARAGHHFGKTVAIYDDAIAVGAPEEGGDSESTLAEPNLNASWSGAAYIFTRTGSDWSLEHYLKAANAGSSDRFGAALALSDGLLFVGAPAEAGDALSTAALPNDDAYNAGAVYAVNIDVPIPVIQVEQPAGMGLVSEFSVVDFGIGLVESVSDAKTFTVRNTGQADLTEFGVSLSGVAASDFRLDLTSLQMPISPGGVSTFSVVFAPLASGIRRTNLHLVSENEDVDPVSIILSGEALTPSAVAQKSYLKASNAGQSDEFGYSVAVSGNTVVVGAPRESGDVNSTSASPNDLADFAGAAYVFERFGLEWIQVAYLKADKVSAFDNFGAAVAISGSTIVVGADGARGHENNARGVGVAYVFENDGGGWAQRACLTAMPEGGADRFGASVAVSDGLIVVGAPLESGSSSSSFSNPNDFAPGAGAAYVFRIYEGSWTNWSYLKAGNAGEGDNFGASVGVSGGSIVVGAPNESGAADSSFPGADNNTPSAGAAYTFELDTTWTQRAYLKAKNAGPGDSFGAAVTISGDTIVIGAAYEDGDSFSSATTPNDRATDAGGVYVFDRIDEQWNQQAYLKAGNAESGDLFGSAVAVSGATLVVGAPGEDGDGGLVSDPLSNNVSDAGAAYMFARSGPAWLQQAYLKVENSGADDGLGRAVALSGNIISVGAKSEDGDNTATLTAPNDNISDAGAVNLFDSSPLGDATPLSGLWLVPSFLSENTSTGTIVGSLSTFDAIPGDELIYSLVGGSGDDQNVLFSVSGTNLVASRGIDFEDLDAVSIRILVKDSFGHEFERSFAIAITDDRTEDADGDGLSEADEEDIHGTSDTNPDSDFDGLGDGFELNFGSDPTSAASPSAVPVITPSTPLAATMRLEIGPGVTGLAVRLMRSNDLNEGSWMLEQDYGTSIPSGQNVQLDVPITPGVSDLFYRLEFYLP